MTTNFANPIPSTKLRRFFIAFAAALIAGCATPASRIKNHPDVYARATPAQQALISQGRIALGFTPGFVRLALGAPDRVTEHTDRSGTDVVWHYVDHDANNVVFVDTFGPFYGGPFFSPGIVIQQPGSERDRLRVTFHDNIVIAFNRVVGG